MKSEEHRVVDRGISSHISNIDFQLWAVLGCRGCREFFFFLIPLGMLLFSIIFLYVFMGKENLNSFKSIVVLGMSSLGVPGVPWHPQSLADQLTLSQPRGTDYAHLITTGTPGFSDLPTALH